MKAEWVFWILQKRKASGKPEPTQGINLIDYMLKLNPVTAEP